MGPISMNADHIKEFDKALSALSNPYQMELYSGALHQPCEKAFVDRTKATNTLKTSPTSVSSLKPHVQHPIPTFFDS